MDLTLLKPFCSTDPTRPTLSAPFCQAGHWYATDGRIAVRVLAEPGTPESVGNYPHADTSLPWGELLNVRAWVAVQPYTGVHRSAPPCDCCHGSGECECDKCGHTHDCHGCNGTGQGDPTWTDQVLGNRRFIGRIYSAMASLPKCEMSAEDVNAAPGVMCCRFRFDGGWGLVMSMNPEV